MIFDGVVALMLAGLGGYVIHLRDLIHRHDHEFQRTKTALQGESKERGKLSRRIAQSETKIAKLAKK